MKIKIDLKIKINIKSISILQKRKTKVKTKGDERMAEKLSPWCKRAKIEVIRKDISVNDLAEQLGNNRSYLSSVLNGRVVSMPIRKRISDLLNISDSDE